jgi:HPt (histidine-containing phosphotransfer) domain-containing protein
MPSESELPPSLAPDELIIIAPDSVAGRLLPAFLDRRVKDLALIDEELARNGFRVIERIGHNWKGIGRSYGFDAVSVVGAAIERAARQHDAAEIRRQAAALAEYLRRVRIAPA